MKKTCLIAAILLTTLHSALAQEPRELPPPIAVASNFLSLSDSQTQALIAMIQTRDAAIRPIAEQIQTNQKALAAMIESANPDPAAVGQLLISIHSGEKQVAAAAQSAAAAFAETLTPEQQQRMQLLGVAAQVAPVLPAFKALGLL
jgi:Spy/CpxP family protein refolding chaperone